MCSSPWPSLCSTIQQKMKQKWSLWNCSSLPFPPRWEQEVSFFPSWSGYWRESWSPQCAACYKLTAHGRVPSAHVCRLPWTGYTHSEYAHGWCGPEQWHMTWAPAYVLWSPCCSWWFQCTFLWSSVRPLDGRFWYSQRTFSVKQPGARVFGGYLIAMCLVLYSSSICLQLIGSETN